MDTSNHLGKPLTPYERVFQLDLFGRGIADQLDELADSQPEAFARLAKAVSGGDITLENAILWRWRVRR